MVSTHILSEVEMTCNHVIIIDEGQIKAQGTPPELVKNMRAAGKISLEVNADAIAFVTSVFAHSTYLIDEQINAVDTEPSIQSFMSNIAQYNITHWGKYWIK